MKISEKRLSQLADMMICHIIYRRMMKALLIAQYLRDISGFDCADIMPSTGYREPKR